MKCEGQIISFLKKEYYFFSISLNFAVAKLKVV